MQYHSVTFTYSPEQEWAANAAIATVVQPAATFDRAEEYHQRYFEKQGHTPH